MKTYLLIVMSTLLCCATHAAEYPPTDHGGSPLHLQDGDIIWGTHKNISEFTVPSGATVNIAPYDGDEESGRGKLYLTAELIDLQGTIDATGAGYSGGGGGQGGWVSAPEPSGQPRYDFPGGAPPSNVPGQEIQGVGGGDGDGYAPGDGGKPAYSNRLTEPPTPAQQADPARYHFRDAIYSSNPYSVVGDTSHDPLVWMGSGSGGGGGGALWEGTYEVLNQAGGGGGGGSGGGLVSLTAIHEFTFGATAQILAEGVRGANASGGGGADATPFTQGLGYTAFDDEGARGSSGSHGSGGGVSLNLSMAQTINIEGGSKVLATGAGKAEYGGTVKVFLPKDSDVVTSPVMHVETRRFLELEIDTTQFHLPKDHQGADLILADGDVIWGMHSNIGRFEIPEGATVTVAPYDGFPQSEKGRVDIGAQSIEIAGTLTASGSGYSGGGGGAGCTYIINGIFSIPSYGGTAAYLQVVNGGTDAHFSNPGDGGNGDGEFAGQGSTDEAHNGMDGGYNAPEGTGEILRDESVQMGSGGGGGAGGVRGIRRVGIWHPGDGGGGGGNGGGAIVLRASEELQITYTAQIEANGWFGGNAYKPYNYVTNIYGGNAVPPEEGLAGDVSDSRGGRGAGGGILINAESAQTVTIESGASITSLGGGGQKSNGGIVKLFLPAFHEGIDPSIIDAGDSLLAIPSAIGFQVK